jgi:hypothetical protein
LYVGDLVQGLSSCSAQHGRELQLGVQITNESPVSVALRSIKAVTPLGGLRQVTRAWGTCGALPDDYAQFDNVLAAGQSTWLTVTFKVTVRCPIPYPVQFTVGYLIQGHSHTASLPGFVDLGQVPYSGCPAVSAGGRTIIAIDPGTGAIDS